MRLRETDLLGSEAIVFFFSVGSLPSPLLSSILMFSASQLWVGYVQPRKSPFPSRKFTFFPRCRFSWGCLYLLVGASRVL